MEKRYKLILSSRKIYREVSLPESTKKIQVGTQVDADVRFRQMYFFEPFSFSVTNVQGNWQIECGENLYVSSGDMRKLVVQQLEDGKIATIKYRESGVDVLSISLAVDFDYYTKKYDRIIEMGTKQSVRIGGYSNSDIRLCHESTKNDSFMITKQGNNYFVNVESMKVGTNLNGQKVTKPEKLKPLDFISVGPYSFCFQNEKLYTDSSEEVVYSDLNVQEIRESFSHHEYPKFNRSTRIKEVLNEEKIEILDPPTAPKKPRSNIAVQIFPAVAMLLVTVLLRLVMNSSGMAFVLMSACTMGIGVISSLMNIKAEKQRYKEDVKKRNKTYEQYISRKKQFLEESRAEEAGILERKYYSIPQEADMAEKFLPNLFEREPEDDDYLEVRLGTGEREAVRKTDIKQRERVEDLDELMKIPGEVAEEYKMLKGVPVTLKLGEVSQVGITGSRSSLYNMLKVLTMDLASRHYYTDVNFLYCIGDEDRELFSWVKMLPHIQNEILNRRNIICDDESKGILLEYLYKELSRRTEQTAMPKLVVFIYRDRGIQSHPVSELMKTAREKGITFIFFHEYAEQLPKGCGQIIELSDDYTGRKIDSKDGMKAEKFTAYRLEDAMISTFVKKLAPIYCEEISLESTLTKNITFFELLNIYGPEDVDLGRNWASAQVYRTMAAPLGVKAKNQMIYLNLHEKAHGPHGLVAGTTGSGKSEIIQTYILSMALLYHPYDVAFMIIDFKGGGVVNQFKKLPHLVGAITNIDGREIERSLLSIRAELKKRQELFAEYNVNHIDAYIKLYKQGVVQKPLPHLILIVDEFAELKMEQPEFMKELISAARIGRSLGVHLILATQKPSGVVDPQIWSNSRFKLCLKVQSKEDSNEVIKNPLAAEITEPGRAYLQVGNNEIFELFQSAYSGASAKTDGAAKQNEFIISRVNMAGKRTTIYEQRVDKSQEQSQSQLESVVDYVSGYCEREHIMPLPYICLPPLPTLLKAEELHTVQDITEGLKAYLGLYDDPSRQYQGRMELNVTLANTFIIGSAQNGKTNLLQTILRSLVEQYSPEQLNLYILDFGSMIFRNYEALHHVGGVVCSNEDEKCRNLFKLLYKEVDRRKDVLAEAGVSSFASYLEAGLNELPQIVVMIDNLTAMRELYLMQNDFLLPLCREGIAVGISFVIANAQTSGIGYRYLANFERRIALFCNDSAEYNAMFDSCRKRPENIPGRGLVEMDKNIYEAQMYLAFEGEKEIERVTKILEFVQKKNQYYPDMFAKKIPVVPKKLTAKVLKENFLCESDKNQLALGVDYATVAPVLLSWCQQGILAMSGQDTLGKANFVKHVIEATGETGAEMYVLDDLVGTIGYCQQNSAVKLYSKSSEDIVEMLSVLTMQLERRYQWRVEGKEDLIACEPVLLLMIQNSEVLTRINGNAKALELYKQILEKYKGLKACIIFTDLENKAENKIDSYNPIPPLKLLKENGTLLLFEDLANIKIKEMSQWRNEYKKPLEQGEAYLVKENQIQKLKVME